MRLKGFIGPAYTLQTVSLDCQRCVNLFTQINEAQGAEDGEIGALVPTPGLTLLGTAGTGPIRGLYATSNGAAVAAVSGSKLYRITSGWTMTYVGDLLTDSGPVSMADNGVQIMVVDGTYGYILSLSTGTFEQITSDAFPGADTVTFQDGYFICNNPGTGQWFISGLYNGLSWDALDFVTAEGSPDNTVGVLSNQRQVWVFGEKSIEVWWNSGASDYPFSRIDGAYIEYGCGAPHTAARYSNSVIWVGGGPNAAGIVWMAQGYQPKRISNHGVEVAIQSYGDITDATAWVYQHDGHAFYCLNFPSANATWVYDISTGTWHERCYLGTDGTLERHRAEAYAFAFDTHIVGDYETGNIYALDHAAYTDNGNAIVRLRRAPHLSVNGRRLYFGKFQLMSQMGMGLDGSPAVGTDPVAELRWSDDFGNTWSNAITRSLGKSGQYANRAIWRRLGQSRNRVFEIRVTDPVPVVLLGAELDAAPGGN